MTKRIGIEKMSAYPGQLCLSFKDLSDYRNIDASYYFDNFMVKNRSLNPPYEDTVTMAVNATKDFLNEDEIKQIGLLIVSTESGVDLEKTVSSWVHKFLKLPSDCRNFEIKSACYCGTAALRMAEAWIRSGSAKGRKALIINSDQSTELMNRSYEFLGGAGAVAMLISDTPKIVELEEDQFGVYAHEITDVVRPYPWYETGNSQASLFSYMEALDETYEQYKMNVSKYVGKDVKFRDYFNFNIFHVPFPGISLRAFKQLLEIDEGTSDKSYIELYNQRTKPSIKISQEIGGTYGGSIYFGLLSLLHDTEETNANQRIGIFSYGSGSCAEYFSCLICEGAKQAADLEKVFDKIKNRTECTVEQYQECEKLRTISVQSENFQFNFDFISKQWFDTHYRKENLLYLHSIKDYFREYRFGSD